MITLYTGADVVNSYVIQSYFDVYFFLIQKVTNGPHKKDHCNSKCQRTYFGCAGDKFIKSFVYPAPGTGI